MKKKPDPFPMRQAVRDLHDHARTSTNQAQLSRRIDAFVDAYYRDLCAQNGNTGMAHIISRIAGDILRLEFTLRRAGLMQRRYGPQRFNVDPVTGEVTR